MRMENRLKLLIDIAYGMTELHDKYIIHRDLKTDNILVFKYDEITGKFYGKVCDFASAIIVKTNNKVETFAFMTTKYETFAFMAPELLIRIDINRMINWK